MSVPGVSGGTMAMALGYYGPMLKAVARIREKGNFFFLCRLLLGGIPGFLTGALLINGMMELLPLTGTMLFTGAVLSGAWVLWKETEGDGIPPGGILCFLLGLILVLAADRLPAASESTSPLTSILCGTVLAAGLILPGISTSHLLSVFGLYPLLSDFSPGHVLRLIPPAMGAVIGTLLLAKPLAFATERYPRQCNLALLGFSLGSLKGLITPCFATPRWHYLPAFQIPNGILLASAAAMLILRLRKYEGKNEKKGASAP